MTEPAPEPVKKKKRLRDYPVFPTLLTAGNLACGVTAILCAMNAQSAEGLLVNGAILVFCAMIFDMFDGKVARLTGTDGEFGGELDSLADVISFGVAPAMLVYRLILGERPTSIMSEGMWWIWFIAIFYAVMAAIRLARYNVEHSEEATRTFRGLPSPGAAAMLVAWVWLYGRFTGDAGASAFDTSFLHQILGLKLSVFQTVVRWFLAFSIMMNALLMVSPFPFLHFGNTFLSGRLNLYRLVGLILAIGLLAMQPAYVLVLATTVYVFSGALPGAIRFCIHLIRRRRIPDEEELEGNGEA